MSADALAQIAAAREHIETAVRRLAAVVHALDEVHNAAQAVDSTGVSAVGHLYAVADVVGSSTARELGDLTAMAMEHLRQNFTPQVSSAIESCRQQAEALNAVFERAERLAAQLGA